MTVRNLTNELYEVGHGSDEVEILVADHVCKINHIYLDRETGKICIELEKEIKNGEAR